MKPDERWLPLAGRLCFVLLFLPSGIEKIAGFERTLGFIASKGLPLPPLWAAAAIVVEVVCSVALLFGWRTRLAAALLCLYTAMTAMLFHAFWAVPEAQVLINRLSFFKNLGIVAGLLTLAAWGAGRFSLDARRVPAESDDFAVQPKPVST